jgi:hypothetical protein
MRARSDVAGRPAASAPEGSLPGTQADRRAYLDGGLSELTCDSCGVTVRVKKSSVQQTSVQWNAAAVRGCTEFTERAAHGRPSPLVATCVTLRTSIERAAHDGRLPTGTDSP